LNCWVELNAVYQTLKRRQMETHIQYFIEKLKNLLL